jgi:hypothetical protein
VDTYYTPEEGSSTYWPEGSVMFYDPEDGVEIDPETGDTI